MLSSSKNKSSQKKPSLGKNKKKYFNIRYDEKMRTTMNNSNQSKKMNNISNYLNVVIPEQSF